MQRVVVRGEGAAGKVHRHEPGLHPHSPGVDPSLALAVTILTQREARQKSCGDDVMFTLKWTMGPASRPLGGQA